MKSDELQGTIEKYKKIRHIRTQEQLRRHTTVGSPNTFRKYLNNPDLMPLGIFEEIMTALNVPKEEKIELLTK